jgi:hypothetical protein
MVDRAEPVRDAVLAAVPQEKEVCVAELIAAGGAIRDRRIGAGPVGLFQRLPVRALHRPRDDVLEPAEDGATPAYGLSQPVALRELHFVSTPAASREV